MPRYFFHQRMRNQFLPDSEGCEIADYAAAEALAIRSARQLWASAILEGVDLTGDTIEVADTDGKSLLILDLASVLPFRVPSSPASEEISEVPDQRCAQSRCSTG